MTDILASDVFPSLNKDPTTSVDEDIIPDKFGSRWFFKKETEEKKPEFALIEGQEKELVNSGKVDSC